MALSKFEIYPRGLREIGIAIGLAEMYANIFPALPKDTLDATRAAFGKKNIYIVIGDRANALFADLDFASYCPDRLISKELACLLSLVTVFQFEEGLADRQAEEATRVRIDWKYALHLSLIHPGLDARALCDFRQCLFADEHARELFQMLLERLQVLNYLPPQSKLNADLVLHSVCSRSRLELIAFVMQAAVVSLASIRSVWLRDMMCPHWYQRYSHPLSALQVPDELSRQIELAESVGDDGVYLLKEVTQDKIAEQTKLVEIQTLEKIWAEEFEWHSGHCKWRLAESARCKSCGGTRTHSV
jgi:transposase